MKLIFLIIASGSCKLFCSTSKIKNVLIKFAICENRKSVLGGDDCEKLSLIKRLHEITVTANNSKEKIIKNFPTLFSGDVTAPSNEGNKISIKLSNDAIPVAQLPRRIPQVLHNKLKLTLDNFENQKIVSKVTEPCEWTHNLVIVEKTDGSLRLCLDPRLLNKYVLRDHHLIPKPTELINELKGNNYFTVLDCQNGFFQLELTEESSFFCVFNTPFGKYKFNRLPQGISCAPEIYQRHNMNIFGHIALVYFDDIIISAKTKEEHDKILMEVLELALENKVKFNKDKFQYSQQTVKYIGYIVGNDQIKVDDEFINAIKDLKSPTNIKERRILGMISSVSRFIPNVTEITAPLRNLLKKNIEFIWSKEHEDALSTIKTYLISEPVLKMFDCTKPIVIEVDSFKDNFGVCLLQDEHPI